MTRVRPFSLCLLTSLASLTSLAGCERAATSAQPDAAAPDTSTADTTTSEPSTSDASTQPQPQPRPEPARTSVDVASLYWASPTGDGRSRVDIIDMPDAEALYALSDAHGNPDGITAAFPASIALPGGHAIGDEWVIATPEGERRAKAVAYGAYGGAGETHFIVVLDAPAQGLAARASAWSGAAPQVRLVDPNPMDQGEMSGLYERIAPAIVASADGGAAKALQRRPLSAAHAYANSGNFPGGFTHIVSIVRPLRPNDIAAERVAGLFLADASGNTLAISPLTLTLSANEVECIVDVEGDGIDEVVFTSSYYEGSYLVFLSWDAQGNPLLRTLEGDGA